MKKIFKMMFAVVAGVAALTACTNEPEEGVTPDNTQEYCIVKVGMSDATKGSLTDAEGIKWEVGDQIKYAGGAELTSEALTAEDIEDDGYTANFKFSSELNAVNRTGWFTTSTRNLTEFDFELNKADGNVYSQTEAGVMNSDYIFLHSGTSLINITAGVTPEVEMYVAGGIFRFMPYTETYNSEVVKSVELKSNNGKHLVGTVAYDRGAGTYRGANEVNWAHPKPLVKVSLDEPFALTNANSRENSKGIYMAIARTTETNPIVGYTITVKTDVATYTFSSDENLVVGDNELRNVYLKLENGSRIGDDDFKGYVIYESGPHDETIGADVTYTNSIGYTVASVSDTNGENWKKCENKGQHEWLYNATYKYYDMNGNEVAAEDSWVTMGFSENNICHWCVNTEVNTGVERKMKVVGQIVAPEGYKLATSAADLTEKEYKYEFIITQQSAGSKKKITFAGDLVGEKTLTASAQSNVDLGYWLAYLNNQPFNGTENYALYPSLKCISRADYDNGNLNAEPCDWIKAYLQNDGNGNVTDCRWKVNVLENTSTEARQAVIIQTWNAEIYDGNLTRVVFITQSGKVEYEEGQYVVNFSCAVMAQQNVNNQNNTLYLGPTSATCNGEAVDMTQVSPVCDADWVEPWWENTNNYNFGVKVKANDTGAARETKVYVEYNGIRSENYIVVHQDA